MLNGKRCVPAAMGARACVNRQTRWETIASKPTAVLALMPIANELREFSLLKITAEAVTTVLCVEFRVPVLQRGRIMDTVLLLDCL
jgi:hypothetical protein